MVTQYITGLPVNTSSLQRLAYEIRYATSGFSTQDWVRIVGSCAALAAKDTAISKVNTAKAVGKALSNTVKRYSQQGVVAAAQDDLNTLKLSIYNLPVQAQRTIQTFRALSPDAQREQASSLLLTMIVFWAAAGGSDLEGGLPDTDLLLGPGLHRNAFSHTIFLGLGMEFAMRMGVAVLSEIHSHLPVRHARAWDNVHDFVEKNKTLAVSAVWAGIGLHFLKDANLFAHATKPYVGLPGTHPMGVHQALFAANGAACEAIAATNKP